MGTWSLRVTGLLEKRAMGLADSGFPEVIVLRASRVYRVEDHF